jgi:hypothetical protein
MTNPDQNPPENIIRDEHGPAAPDAEWTPPAHAAEPGGVDIHTGDALVDVIYEALAEVGRADLATAIHLAGAVRKLEPEPVRVPDYVTIPNPTLSGSKPSNPKDGLGILKVAISCVSLPVLLEVGVGMLEGALKYGRHNYRVVGVRASVYVDATFRHLAAFWEGEDLDPDSAAQLSHVTKAITSLTVLRDSMIAGNWVDDRPPVTAPKGWLNALNEKVRALLAQFPTPVPPYIESQYRASLVASGGNTMPVADADADEESETVSEVG